MKKNSRFLKDILKNNQYILLTCKVYLGDNMIKTNVSRFVFF